MKSGNLQNKLRPLIKGFLGMRVPLFLLLIVLVYGYVAWRASTLASASPSVSAVDSQTKATASPHIDQTIVDKINKLQDNSVNVQALFNQARQNPFQE